MTPTQSPPHSDMNLRDLLRVLWRRRYLISGSLVAVIAGTAITLTQITPLYTATASVMVDPRQTNVVDLDQVLSGLPVNAETVQSEIEILRSRNLAARVVDKLKLADNPEFNPAKTAPLASDAATQKEMTRNEVVTHLMDDLSVKVAGRSRVIAISFVSANPRLSAVVANTVADLYLEGQQEIHQDATRNASTWLNSRLEQLRIEAEAAELAVSRFKKENGLDTPLEIQDDNLPAQDRSEAKVRLRTLEREAQASRTLFETFLNRSKQTSEQQGLEQADARLISRAEMPSAPSFPDKKLFLLLAALAGLGLGVASAFLIEQLDSGFRSSDQIETRLGLPTLAMVPSLSSLGIKNIEPEAYVVEKPNSALAESIRGLRTSLLLSNVDSPPRVLMLTSALPGEGKTTTALSLARLAALGGEKVIVIDADLRRPRVHSALHAENTTGLVEVLSGQATLEQVTRTAQKRGANFHFISAGKPTAQATELIRSQAMAKLVRDLSEIYALVIIDTPPVLPVADSRVLARLVHKVVYVVRWHKTPRETVAQAIKQLREAKADFAGVVLNQVDVRRHAEYSYSDSGYYYGKYRKYYTE